MHFRFLLASVCTLGLFALAAPSAHAELPDVLAQSPQTQSPSRQAQAVWLSTQLHLSVSASQILLSPEATALQGCTIARTRRAPTGATALSLRCPASALPHLVLLDLSHADAGGLHRLNGGPRLPAAGEFERQPAVLTTPRASAASSSNIVRAGTSLRADWSSGFIHAQLPVVALDSGVAGAEIRVRIPRTNRIVRARILSANAVAILAAGV